MTWRALRLACTSKVKLKYEVSEQKWTESLKSRMLKLSLLSSFVPAFLHPIGLWNVEPIIYIFIFQHARPPQLRSTVTLDEIWAVFKNLMAVVHAVTMEIATLKGCGEAFVLLNGCKEWQNTRGRWAWRMLSQALIYSQSLPLSRFF